MRGALILATATLAWPAAAWAQGVQTGDVHRTGEGVTLRAAQGTLRIEPRSDHIVHITAFRNADWAGAYNPAMIAPDARGATTIAYTGRAIDVAMPTCR